MLTLDFFKNEISDLGLAVPSDTELSQIIRTLAKFTSVPIDKMTQIDSLGYEFKFEYPFIVDNSVTIFRAATSDNLTAPANVQVLTVYDVGTTPPVLPPHDFAIDHAMGYALLTVSYPSPTVDTDFILSRFGYVDYQTVIDRVLFRASIDDRITEEKRGNVTIKKKSLADTLLSYRKLQGTPNDGLDVGEINFTRLSHGKVYGADPETGVVLP
jgi:hypothetical protein